MNYWCYLFPLLAAAKIFPWFSIQEGSRDILRPLRFKLTYEIIQKDPTPVAEGDRMPDINEYPILNQKGALRYCEDQSYQDEYLTR